VAARAAAAPLRLLLLALPLAVLLPGAPSGAGARDAVTEEATGVAFPARLAVPGSEDGHVLLGTAVRTKTFLDVQVYALGLYAAPGPARETLAAWSDRGRQALVGDEALFEALRGPEIPKSLRFQMVRDVEGDDIADAFDESLRPRVEARGEGDEGQRALAALRRWLGERDLAEGDRLQLAWLPGRGVLAARPGEEPRRIRSEVLGAALFDLYLGRDPLTDAIRRDLVWRLSELLAGG